MVVEVVVLAVAVVVAVVPVVVVKRERERERRAVPVKTVRPSSSVTVDSGKKLGSARRSLALLNCGARELLFAMSKGDGASGVVARSLGRGWKLAACARARGRPAGGEVPVREHASSASLVAKWGAGLCAARCPPPGGQIPSLHLLLLSLSLFASPEYPRASSFLRSRRRPFVRARREHRRWETLVARR